MRAVKEGSSMQMSATQGEGHDVGGQGKGADGATPPLCGEH